LGIEGIEGYSIPTLVYRGMRTVKYRSSIPKIFLENFGDDLVIRAYSNQ